MLRALPSPDLQLVREVLATITGGQELDLQRFSGASCEHIIALQTDQELDDYTYRVAGCVGEFWTRMCRHHLFPRAPLEDTWLLANGVRFGKGLQLVNVLRDLPADLRQGRCYLPGPALLAAGLTADDLLEPVNEPRVRPIYDLWLARAEGHLQAGWAYTNALPRRSLRVRLACAWPILIGVETLKLLRQGNILDANHRLKVPRTRVKKLIARSILLYPFSSAWQNLVRPLPPIPPAQPVRIF
jgi:farnesyl-diphosphate farnesyltransferase